MHSIGLMCLFTCVSLFYFFCNPLRSISEIIYHDLCNVMYIQGWPGVGLQLLCYQFHLNNQILYM